MKTKGIYFLYRVLQAFALPVLLFYFALRGFRNRGYWQSLPQRFGFLPRSYTQTTPGAIWLHAVSVGEVLSCVEFLRRLHEQFPRTLLFVSIATLAGRTAAEQKLQGIADGIFYAPVDYVFAVRRVLRTLRPGLVLVAETEIWPNLFREIHRTRAGLAIVNGRISDNAYPNYLPYRWFFECVLPQADLILTQTEGNRKRFLAIGAPPGRVQVGGNFKYDFEPRPIDLQMGGGRVWIAASTMPPADSGDVDEDDCVIASYRALLPQYPDLRLILAPRKPERFDVVARKLEAANVRYARRSHPGAGDPRVILLDTIGELAGLFGRADVVFMGGTLAQRGGHNLLEPAYFGKPVITGPHMENFQAIAQEFRRAGALVEIPDAESLAGAVARLLAHPEMAREIGRKARACAEARRGATSRAVQQSVQLYRIPEYRPAQPWFTVAWLLAGLWRWGSRKHQATALRAQRRLEKPVISIGNLTMGGTGKTPCVLRVTQELLARGYNPAILTRGHGRRSLESSVVAAPGAKVSVERTGDEPQIFIRSGLSPVGIGGNRFEAGMLLAREFDVNVFLLDDGFQHLRLARSVDIVLLDALDPLGGGSIFPLGKLREPAGALARADLIVITRTNLCDSAPAVERMVRQWNQRAPIFRATIEPQAWVEHRTGHIYDIEKAPFRHPGGFCGLGNPQSFRRTLELAGAQLTGWITFGDHHRYRPHQLRHLTHQMERAGADALVTTEKDTINLCESCDELLEPLPLYWLRAAMAIEGEDELLDEIERRLQ